MKLFKLLVAAVAVSFATTASAQFVNASSERSSNRGGGSSSLVMDVPSYNRFYMDFATINTKTTYSYGSESGSADSDDEYALKGFNLGYLHGIGLKKGLPLFVEVGGQLSLGTENDHDYRSTLLSIAVPVDLTYRVQLSNGFYVAPYLGMRLKVNVLGQTKYTGSGSYDPANWFDEDDMGEDMAYKRFQVGGIAGANIGYKAFNLNIGYTFDSPLWKYSESGMTGKMKTGGIVVGLGYNF